LTGTASEAELEPAMNLEAHNPDPVMVEIGLAIELEEEVMVTLEGNITDAPTISWGRETKYLLTRPKLLFFVTREQVDCVYRSAIWCSWCSWCSHMAGWRLIEAEWSQTIHGSNHLHAKKQIGRPQQLEGGINLPTISLIVQN
jgi:hypothetical protein